MMNVVVAHCTRRAYASQGLFYCMWFSDKPLVQQELAENLARLVEHLQPARAVLFVNAFMQTMIREWTGIDRYGGMTCVRCGAILTLVCCRFSLRLDKFMSLVRKAVHHMLQYLHKRQWDQQLLEQFVNILRRFVSLIYWLWCLIDLPNFNQSRIFQL